MSDIQYSKNDVDNISGIQHTVTEDEEYLERSIAEMIWNIYSPFLLCVGIIGNTLSFITLNGRVLRARVSSIFLRALSVADTMALLFGLLTVWLIHLTGYDVTIKHDVICKLRNFLFYTFSDNSVWLICAFTFDRLVAVRFPFRKKTICTRRNAYIAIFIVCALSCIKNGEILVSRRVMQLNGSQALKCGTPNSKHNYFETYVRPWVVFSSVSAIPCLFIVTCNIIIIQTFYKMQKSPTLVCLRGSNGQKGSALQVASMTRMCLTVSCTFLLLVSPSVIVYIGRPYWRRTPVLDARYYLARAIANLCQYTNNSINFLLYCGSGQIFRREVKMKLRCTKDRRHIETYIHSNDVSTCVNNVRRGPTAKTLVSHLRVHQDEHCHSEPSEV